MSPTYFEEEDVASMLGDSPDAVDVTIAGVTTKGVRDTVDRQVLTGEGAQLFGKVRRVTVRTGSLPGLSVRANVTVEDEEGLVVSHEQVGDGALTEIRFREAP